MIHTLIPAKGFRQSKQRLVPLLDERARAELSAAMLRRTIAIVTAAMPGQPVSVVTTDADVFECVADLDVGIIRPIASGLNPELAEAAQLRGEGNALLVIHADLPLLGLDDIHALLAAPTPIVIAPDHAGTGTNALLQRGETRFFEFGADSCRRHVSAAQDAGRESALIRTPGLGGDVDCPDDFARMLPMSPLLRSFAPELQGQKLAAA